MDPNQQSTTQTASQAAYMQSRVEYIITSKNTPNPISGGTGLLEWNNDGHIRLFAIDKMTNQVQQVLLDCLPAQIPKVKATWSQLTFNFGNSQLFSMSFSAKGFAWAAFWPTWGSWYLENKQAQASGIQW